MRCFRVNAAEICNAASVFAAAAVAFGMTLPVRGELPLRVQGGLSPVLMPAEAWEKTGAAARELSLVVADLGSVEYATRDRASTELLSRGDVTLESLGLLMRQPGLSMEAKSRLLGAAKEIFLRMPRGALGVQFGMGQLVGGRVSSGLTISRLIPGFPSSKTLRVGDEIVAVNSIQVQTTSTFNPDITALRPHVIARDPGAVVRVTVRRPKGEAPANGWMPAGFESETVTVDVELGAFDNLQRNNPQFGDFLSASQLALAWTIRQTDLLGQMPVAGENLAILQLSKDVGFSVNQAPRVALGGEANEGRPSERDPRQNLARDGGNMRGFGNLRQGGGMAVGQGFAGMQGNGQGRWQIQVIDPALGPGIAPLPIPDLKLDLGNADPARQILPERAVRRTVREQIVSLTVAREAQLALVRELKRAIGELGEEPDPDALLKQLTVQISEISQKVGQIDQELKRLRFEAGDDAKAP